jgi:alpha-glucosidase
MVGEIGDDDGLGRMAEYTRSGPDGQPMLHMAYCFDLLGTKKDAPFLQTLFNRFLSVVGDGWPCWALSNHDCMRLASRWGGQNPNVPPDPRLLRLAAALQMTLRGTPCIYQGDELGLPEADVAYEDLRDPFGITMWPSFKGRDGCRTPMPWASNEPQAGFSPAKPWLPASPAHAPLAVDAQQGKPDSLLTFYTRLLHWRRDQPALVHGDMAMHTGNAQVLAYERSHQGQRLLCVFNFSAESATWPLPLDWQTATTHDIGLSSAERQDPLLVLPPWGGWVASL